MSDRRAKKFNKRIAKEAKQNEKNEMFEFKADGSDWYFTFTLKEGLYKGQTHTVLMRLKYGALVKYSYPLDAPLCLFKTPIWHPNISTSGIICLDVLKDKWTPAMQTSKIITAIKLLLDLPNASSPMNSAAAGMISDPVAYRKKIKSFASQ